ncbi:DoxX family protein [Streptomyces apocyni]|uniref:DoxX family protein n=1 Tax=Streptomyces apocyni TaxID=2654677 RepID=UPI001E5B573E|nr:DoxX family membrane protein [Streptomyces apocyni]
MSVDTRTPRTPTGGPSGFDDGPALSMVKVPCDPAQVIVNHASFRVQLPAAQQPRSPRITRPLAGAVPAHTARIPVAAAGGAAGAVGGVVAGAAAAGRRRAPVVWSGKSEPGDLAATGLLQAVRSSGVRHGASYDEPFDADGFDADGYDADETQLIPRFDDDATQTIETPQVFGPRGPSGDETRALPVVPGAGAAAGFPEGLFRPEPDHGYDEPDAYADDDEPVVARRRGADPVRHAYYPGRRMNLGVVLLPLRVFLGFISIYAGMGKLCDPVYFDGGERGSMVKWLSSLHPWTLAEPMRDFALSHPVGAGLTIAFLQVIVGVLTVLGLWQRLAASVGALLSAALLVTVSWKSVPVYDTPDIIYLAAWSPLIIAGAPVYSADGRLASEAWRRLGPRAGIWELRRRVLRRGALIATLVVGLTLLLGALLGSAVRDSGRVIVPGPGEPPRNVLPGSPLPSEPGARTSEPGSLRPSASQGPTQGNTTSPSTPSQVTPEAARESSTAGAAEQQPTESQPSQTQGTTGEEAPQPPPQQAPPPPPSTSAGPTSSGGTDDSTDSGTSTGGPDDGASGGTSSGGQPGLVGGLLG